MDQPSVKCALCYRQLETLDERIPFTAGEDIVIVRCKGCRTMIYARRENRLIEPATWKASA